MKYSVIDISSSSISMMVADTNDRITEIIFRDRASLTLLHYLDGRDLSQRGIDKLVEAVSLMKDKCLSLGVDVVYLISTAALRAVGNFEEIGAAILNRPGLPVNAVDGQTEAYCDYIANRFYSAYESAVLLDIGGASVEICDLSADDRAQMHSLNFGILTLHNKFVEKIQPDEGEAKPSKNMWRASWTRRTCRAKAAMPPSSWWVRRRSRCTTSTRSSRTPPSRASAGWTIKNSKSWSGIF